MSGYETAYAQVERRRLFPRRWGDAPGDPELRAAWVLAHVTRDSRDPGRTSNAAAREHAALQLQLLRRRYGPGE